MRHSSQSSPLTSSADAAVCRAMLRGGSRTFFAASLVLPSSVRKPATGLYAFCRMADDAIDQGKDRGAALKDLRARLEQIYAGTPRNIVADRAFTDAVHRFAIPRAFPEALLEGFEWDAENRRYDDLSQLTAYAVRVAGTVGAMMGMVMGVHDRALLARACDLGIAMQLTNIARDVGEDARNGRLYLPLQWMREAHIDPQAWLVNPAFGDSIAGVIERVIEAAATFYARSDSGLANLPAACRPGMYAARLMYAEIGREVARRGFDSVSQRAVVSWQRKARILADSVLTAATAKAAFPVHSDVPAQANFLFDTIPAVIRADCFDSAERGTVSRLPRIENRVLWVLDLFERLEQRERSRLNPAQMP